MVRVEIRQRTKGKIMSDLEFSTVHLYQRIVEACERNNLTFEQERENSCAIVADELPYARNTTICYAKTFKEAMMFLQGYEQHKFESEYTNEHNI